jgi:hypothetical protein
MHYLGRRRGAGILTYGGQKVARVDYESDGFLTKPGQVTGCSEIRTPPEVLRRVFGRKDVQLLTDDRRHLSLRFSEKRLHPTSDAAHVDVAGELPPVSEWDH